MERHGDRLPHGGGLGRLDEPDPDAGQDERGEQDQDAAAGAGEDQVRGQERAGADDQGMDRATPVAEVTARQACEGPRDVVADVEEQRDLRRGMLAARRCQQSARAKDHQRRGRVAELEGSHPDEEPAEASSENRANLESDRSMLPDGGPRDVARRVVDRDRSQQTGNDRQQDGLSQTNERDEQEGE
jgi:hypothetical protein